MDDDAPTAPLWYGDLLAALDEPGEARSRAVAGVSESFRTAAAETLATVISTVPPRFRPPPPPSSDRGDPHAAPPAADDLPPSARYFYRVVFFFFFFFFFFFLISIPPCTYTLLYSQVVGTIAAVVGRS